MTRDLEDVYRQLADLSGNLDHLRGTYGEMASSYKTSLERLKSLTGLSAEAAKCASFAADKARIAVANSVKAAESATQNPEFSVIVNYALTAALAACSAAVQAAAAASAAGAAASEAAFHQAESSMLQYSADATLSARQAADAAAEAVKLADPVREKMNPHHKEV